MSAARLRFILGAVVVVVIVLGFLDLAAYAITGLPILVVW